MNDVIRVSMLAIIGVLVALQFKQNKPQFSALIGISLGLMLFGACVGRISGVMDKLGQLKNYLGIGAGYFGVLVKVLGITYICEFASGICRDAGYSVAAGQIELLGKLSVMLAGLSILFAVIEQIQALL